MLNDIFSPERIKLNLESTTKNEVFEELINTIAVPESEFDSRELFDAVNLRESKMNTIIMPGIAVPHGYCSSVRGIIGAIGFSMGGVEYDSRDKAPVHTFVMLLMDESSREQHLQVLSRLLELLNSASFATIKKAKTPEEVYTLLGRY